MCREEAIGLASQRETISGELGIRMVAVCHEEKGVQEFNDGFWKGECFIDEEKGFICALGGGTPNYLPATQGLLNKEVRTNYARAKEKNIEGNLKGEGRFLGGLLLVDENGVQFEYKEKVFGDHAQVSDVLDACRKASRIGKE